MELEDIIRWHLRYDAEAGILYRLQDTRGGRRGDVAGCRESSGYVTVRFGSKFRMRAHRIAWLLHFGKWPTREIDHINGDKADNRIANLRDVTPAENQLNSRLCTSNTSGYRGVSLRSGKWRASAQLFGKRYELGRYSMIEDAAAAYRRFIDERAGDFAYHNCAGAKRRKTVGGEPQ